MVALMALIVLSPTQFVVVSQPGATPDEVYAAKELATHITAISGYPASIESQYKRNVTNIVIGPGPTAKQHFPSVNFASLKPEEVVIKGDGDLLLAGGSPRGTLYAVYRWLHRQGVRWWTPWATTIPHVRNFRIKAIDVRESPAFEARDPFWFCAFDGDWAARNYSNSQSARLEARHGGKLTYEGFVHTYYPLVPPSENFAKHPEWYALVNGKRTAENAQLCTTNPELREFVVKRVRELLAKNPAVNIVSVSQNDCFQPCECSTCKALDDREGSHSATVLSLANYVAANIAKDYPNVAIDTLAYQYSRKAPKTLRPLPNVIVRLCSIECNFAQPFTHKSNASFEADLKDWSRLTQRLYVWDYVTNFSHYVQPFPNYAVLGPNLKCLHQNGVRGVFEEGAYQSQGADMAEMRAWVLAQLMWDPYQDDKKLTQEFLKGYYGRAAGSVEQALNVMTAAAAEVYSPIFIGPDAKFLNFQTMVAAERYWQSAATQVSSDPELSRRVRIARLSPHSVWLERWDQFRAEAEASNIAWPVAESKRAFAAQWLKDAKEPGPSGWTPVTVVNEGSTPPEEFVKRMTEGSP